MSVEKWDIRKRANWRTTDLPLTNKTVRVVLSNSTDARKLAKAVRISRKTGKMSSFKVSSESAKALR